MGATYNPRELGDLCPKRHLCAAVSERKALRVRRAERGTSTPSPAAWAQGRRLYLQLLALVVELLPVVLQLADLAVELGHHRVSLLLQLAVPGLLLLHANLPDLDVLLL